MAICHIYQKSGLIGCPREALEGDKDGLCLLHSSQKNKDKDGNFTDAVKKKLDAEDYDFGGVFFPGLANFHGLKFTKKADFSRATFQEANFSGATFGEVNFSEATFQEAIFHEANITDGDFSNATFKRANFSNAIFQEANFFGVRLKEAIFNGAKINGRITLASIQPLKEDQLWLLLEFIKFGEKGVLRLEDLSLARTIFTGTNLRAIEFDRVTWASWWWRAAVYEEIRLHRLRRKHTAGMLKPSLDDYAPVERLYRQLKINYEEERDFKRVGDFHYGEMEMHRRGSPWRQWLPFSWYNLYRVLSGYGERPLRAFIWLLLLIPAWAGLVWGLGIDQAGSQAPLNYWDALLFIFEKATLQRPPWTEIANINWPGKLLASLSVLLLPGQAALFILALRNRLGRRR